MNKNFIYNSSNSESINGISEWQSPSNIALVKYWGKKPNQIPMNPSLSLTLSNCCSKARISYQSKNVKDNNFDFSLLFEGKREISFEDKLFQFFNRIKCYCPYLLNLKLIIETSNSFPHSSGIASSASFYSALSLSIMDIEKHLNPEIDYEYFFKKASFLARLGSGSACRSIMGPISIWGFSELFSESSDLYANIYPNKVNSIFKNINDTVLLVDKGKKEVSSSFGHDLMNGHSFSSDRIKQAHNNLKQLNKALENGNYDLFIKIVEIEALSLHAMMMTSQPYFILIKPNTLKIINEVWKYRKENKSNICFTLDAGANIHLLYPENEYDKIQNFISSNLVSYCENGEFINDKIGNGPNKL
ncbi:MAG: diphosphomevalonate decarboxylase [Flavobacteriaceae bacterium]|nr:diphosphomevalonate decarboxylase [Flavobacteriaceae bacterium]